MRPLNARHQAYVGLALAILMLVTRGQHASLLSHPLPDASFAVFFLAGFYVRPTWVFAALFGEGFLIDLAAVTWGGVSGFCMSPAYLFLVPAYAAMWAGGRWYAGHFRLAWRTLVPLGASLLVSATIAEVLSSGGFYAFSGRFADLGLAEFGARFVSFFPSTLEALVLYSVLAAAVHAAFAYMHLRIGARDLRAR